MKNKTSAKPATSLKPIAETVMEDKHKPLPAPVPLQGELRRVELEACHPAPGFNRTDLDLNAEFLASVRDNGVVQPALVRTVKGGEYEIIAGNRRHAAAVMAKQTDWPVMVVAATDQQVRELRLVENLQRADLTALDEARQYQAALASGDYGTGKAAVQALAARLGRGITGIYDKLQLLKAGPAVQKAVSAGTLDWSTGALLAKIADPATQAEALQTVLEGTDMDEGPMTFRQAKAFITQEYQMTLKGAPFELGRRYEGVIEGRTGKGCQLVTVGPCEGCPRRENDTCTDPACWAAKRGAHADALLEEGRKRGQTVIAAKQAKELFNEWGKCPLRGDKYVDLAAMCPATGHEKAWKTVLGKHAPPAILAVDPQDRVRELLLRTEADAALKASGFKPRKEISSYGPSKAEKAKQKAREQKNKDARIIANTCAPAILKALVKGATIDARLWPLLAQAVFDTTGIEHHEVLAKRRGWARVCNEARGGIEKWLKGRTDPAELAAFCVECLLLAPGAHSGSWGDTGLTKEFQAAAKLAGVPLKMPKTEHRTSNVERRTSKAKPAKNAKVKAKVKK